MNKNELLCVIAKNGDNQSILANAIGISRVSLSKKINEKGKASFNQCEMLAIKRRYNLTDKEMDTIFFSN